MIREANNPYDNQPHVVEMGEEEFQALANVLKDVTATADELTADVIHWWTGIRPEVMSTDEMDNLNTQSPN